MSPSAFEHALVPEDLGHRDLIFLHPVNVMEARDTLSWHVPTGKIVFSSAEWSFILEGDQNVLKWFTPICKKLCELLDLPPNWDSYGALPIEPRNVAIALDILNETINTGTPRPSVVPTNQGGVQLEWHTDGIDLEVKIGPGTKVHIFFEDKSRGIVIENEDHPRVQSGVLVGLIERLTS